MRFLDCVHLGLANIRTHKKRAFTVVVIVGVIFGVLTAGNFLIQGLENTILSKMTEPTDGKVLLSITTEQQCFDRNCEPLDVTPTIEQVVKEYGGKIIPSQLFTDGTTLYLVVEPSIFSGLNQEVIVGTRNNIPIYGTPSVLAGLFGIAKPASDASADTKLRAVATLRENTLNKTINSNNSEMKYEVVGITPSSFGIGSFSLANVGERMNPLNLILDIIPAGGGTSFILNNGSFSDRSFADSPTMLAMFPDVEEALAFQRSMVSKTCSLTDWHNGVCPNAIAYQAEATLNNPLAAKESFNAIWGLYQIIEVVLIIIATIVAVSTYTRLIGRDTKVIALYHALGASHKQIALIYCVYLLGISLIAGIFAILLGAGLVVILNFINGDAITKIFILAFSEAPRSIFLFGVNSSIPVLVGIILFLAPLSAIVNYAHYTSSKLSQKLK